MPQYAAVLGHQPHLSLAELLSAVPGFNLKRTFRGEVAIFDSSENLTPALLDTLGGTVILAERITEADVGMEDIPQMLSKEVSHLKRKVTFSLRCFGVATKDIKTAYRKSKDILRHQEHPCRYIGNDKNPAATALLRGSDILTGKRGCELFIIGGEHGLWVGKTVAAQDIDAYSKRDMGKPVRDTTVGLLPPKLAQIMLNLGVWIAGGGQAAAPTEGKKSKAKQFTVLDPFCGTGVIPMEALLRRWNVLACDLNAKAVTGCQKNLDWLRKEAGVLKKDATDTVWKQDATKPFTLKSPPDMIVTETSLGPALEKRPAQRDTAKLKSESEKLEAAFLKNIAATLPGVPVVCAWPFWRMKGARVQLEKIWDTVHECGYQPALPACVEPSAPGRLTLLYERRDQFVGREIVMLVPRKR